MPSLEEQRNALTFSHVARYDKVRLTLPNWESDRAQQLWNRLIQAAGDILGWSPEYATRHIRMSGYYASKDVNGYYLQLTYKAATLCKAMPFEYARNITEAEVKAFLVPRNDIEGEPLLRFIDDMRATRGSMAVAEFTHGTRSSKAKSGAERAINIGTNRSAAQGKVYKRPGQRVGLEIAMSRDPARKLVDDMLVQVGRVAERPNNDGLWVGLLRMVAFKGYSRIAADLYRRGVDLSDYFTHFTDAAHVDEDDSSVRYTIYPDNAPLDEGQMTLPDF